MRRVVAGLLSVVCFAFAVATAAGQDKYPSRPIKVIVPYAPGGATDIVARIVGDAVQKISGQ
jgi:tripartite-type tricarboxylate transporter receptor subunit TctC